MSTTILYTLAAERLFNSSPSGSLHAVETYYSKTTDKELNLTTGEREDLEAVLDFKIEDDTLEDAQFDSLVESLKAEGHIAEPALVEGFELSGTGGGCTALIHTIGNGLELLITGKGDDRAPASMGQAVTVGLYCPAHSEPLAFVNAPSLSSFLKGEVDPLPAVEKPAPAVVEKGNPRFVWCVGAIQDAFPDIPHYVAQPSTGALVLWDRQEKKVTMSVSREYAQLMCLEVVGNGGAPFTSLEEWMNNTSAEAFESEGVIGTKEEFTK